MPPTVPHLSPPDLAVTWAEPAPEQFDFWCGTWSGETVAGDVPAEAPARNEISWLWDRSVLLEEFSMPTDDGTFHGRSLSVPVPGRGWCETWVDTDGQYLDFVGGLVGDAMLLDRTTLKADGARSRQRMRWWDIGSDAFTWDWLSADEGAQDWTLRWRLAYTRL